jgi:type I restriction enzyme S subunit
MINAPTSEPPKANWEVKTLGEVCLTTAGGTPLKSKREYYENGDIPWLLSGEVCQKEITSSKNFITRIGVENSSAKLYPPDSVLIAMYGATAGQAGILRFEATSNQAVCAILPNEQFLPEFIYYFFLNEKKTLVAKAAGNAQPNISQKKIKDTSIPVPPLAEQERIVGILDEAFEGIAAAAAQVEKNLHNARELFQSVLQSTFSQKGNDWVETTLGEVCGFVRGPFGGSLKKSFFKPDGFAVYEQQHAINDQFESIRYFIDEKKFDEMQRFELRYGDLIMSCSGTMGKVAIVPEGIKRGIINQALLKLTPNKELKGRYLKFWMESPNFQEEINNEAQGAAIKNVASVKILKGINLNLPALPTQQAIVEKLDALSEETKALESIYERKQSALAELKQSLLQKAFAGEL